MKRPGLPLMLLFFALPLFASCEKEQPAGDTPNEKAQWVTIGTDDSTRLSHVTGTSIVRVAGKRMASQGFPVRAQKTAGPVASLNAVRARDLSFAVVGSDLLYRAVRGFGEWEGQGLKADLVAVFTVHTQTVNLIATEDSGIKTIQDLKGKRVHIGKPGSHERRVCLHVLEHVGINFETDLMATEMDAREASRTLQEGGIDAFFSVTEHPNDGIRSATSGKRKVRFVPIADVEGLLLKVPYYVLTRIPVNPYPGAANREDVQTIGHKISLVTSTKTPNKVVRSLLGEVFDNFEKFKELHPAYRSLTKKEMTQGMYRMIHPGAKIWYMKHGYPLSCCF